MKSQYFLRNSLLTPAVLLLSLAGLPGQAIAANGQDPMLMYFDESQMVEVATRAPKPITQVAENVTIITAEEIERMNARSIDDVLNRVAGINTGSREDFNNSSFLSIHSSDYKHVVVMLDGISITKATDDISYVNVIPIQIVKRIEVIRGAASSTWGSALGGVVNIITKESGNSAVPKGNLKGSYGEFGSSDLAANLTGKAGKLGYYLSAGRQESDGIKDDRFYEDTNYYAKFDLPLPAGQSLQVTTGYSKPDYKTSHIPDIDQEEYTVDRNLFFTAGYNKKIHENMNLFLGAHRYFNDMTFLNKKISDGSTNSHYQEDQTTTGLAARLDWNLPKQQIVAGLDYKKNELDLTDVSTAYTAPKIYEENWSVYANDTINLDKLTVTPGLRLDQLSNTKDQVSPSIGLTYRLADRYLARASIAKGFRKPPITRLSRSLTSRYNVNADLEPEEVWSYQTGIETTAVPYCIVKTTLFLHDSKDSFERWDSTLGTWVNRDDAKREGIEVELETAPIWHTSLKANYTYTHHRNENGAHNYEKIVNLVLVYDNPKICTLDLGGHFIKYGDVASPPSWGGVDSHMIWELSINRTLFTSNNAKGELFFVGHNLTNELQFADPWLPNAQRWIEAGLKFYF